MKKPPTPKWWKECVVYQIYPSSFKDSNNDGWGDVRGIISKLDYLQELGVDVAWLSPIYKSPQADMGYDIADYKAIDPMYGSLDDVDDLIAELKKRGMKLMMDLVVNHTSDEHAWFLESRSSKTNPKRDWYIWKPPKGKTDAGKPIPPNNWSQLLGDANSAWTYDEGTGEFYLSLFTPEQPDLNWENPDVRAAVFDVMHFWLSRGCTGFRMDVINHISKDQKFPDAAADGSELDGLASGHNFFINGPRFHEYMAEMYNQVLSKYDCMTVGETPLVSDIDEIMRTVGSEANELNMIFIFDIVNLDSIQEKGQLSYRPFTTADLAHTVIKWQRAMLDHDGWNSLFVGNHDQRRSVSRFTDDSDEFREKGAKLLALMQTTLSGTPYVYQGEEIGMRNVPASWEPEEYKDVLSINYWKKSQEQYGRDRDEAKLATARRLMNSAARDNARTPMQWTASKLNAGFSDDPSVKPWMRVNDDSATVNVEVQRSPATRRDSVLQFWRALLAFRKHEKQTFVYGDFEAVGKELQGKDGEVFAYARVPANGGERALVALNFSGRDVEWEVPQGYEVGKWIVGNYYSVEGSAEDIDKSGKGKIVLRPWEGLLGKCM